MNEKLKPCPFCGARPMVRIRGLNETTFTVECQRDCLKDHDFRHEAIDAWNKRYEDLKK